MYLFIYTYTRVCYEYTCFFLVKWSRDNVVCKRRARERVYHLRIIGSQTVAMDTPGEATSPRQSCTGWFFGIFYTTDFVDIMIINLFRVTCQHFCNRKHWEIKKKLNSKNSFANITLLLLASLNDFVLFFR